MNNMRHLTILLLVINVFGCANKQTEEKIRKEISIEEVWQPQDSLFAIKNMRDTLYAYMDYIDTIPNPFNFPIVYYMEFHKSKSDTIVSYMSNAGLVEALFELSFEAAAQIKDRDLVVFSPDFKSLNHFINEEMFSIDYLHYIDTVIYNTSDMNFMIVYIAPIWEYKYSNGNLILINKDDRGMDKIKKKLGR